MPTYLTTAELNSYLTASLGDAATPADLDLYLANAEAEVDSYLVTAGYTLPLTSYSVELKNHVGALARWYLAVAKARVPEPASQSAMYLSMKMAREWLMAVANGDITPSGIVDAGSGTSTSPYGTIRVSTQPSRTWVDDQS